MSKRWPRPPTGLGRFPHLKKKKEANQHFLSIANQHFLDFLLHSPLIWPFFGTVETSRVFGIDV